MKPFVLQTVVDHYPIRGRGGNYPPNSIRQIPGAFDQIKHRAAGRSLPEILAEARRRMTSTPEDERREVAEQLRQIAVLRLEGALS